MCVGWVVDWVGGWVVVWLGGREGIGEEGSTAICAVKPAVHPALPSAALGAGFLSLKARLGQNAFCSGEVRTVFLRSMSCWRNTCDLSILF